MVEGAADLQEGVLVGVLQADTGGAEVDVVLGPGDVVYDGLDGVREVQEGCED